MNYPILSEEIYNNPAKFEYFIKFKIIGIEDNKKYECELKDNNGVKVNLCGKVFSGELLEEAIKREFFNSFKIEKIIKYSCDEKQESAPNRFGEILPRIIVEVIINKDQIKDNNYNHNFVSWIEIGIGKNSTNLKMMTEYEKEILVLDLYQAGAKTILTSEINMTGLDMKFGMTTVDIPENNKKIVDFIDKYSKDSGYEFKYLPNKEKIEVIMFSWK